MHIQIFIPMKAPFFWKRIQQFNYSNRTSKETKSVFGSSHWEPHRYSELFQNLWKMLVKEFIFGNVVGYRPAVLQKKWNSFSGISQEFCLQIHLVKSWNNYFEENLFNQNISSGYFCLCQQFPKKQRKYTY